MDSLHTVFGLRITSNRSIPGLPPLNDSGSSPDLRIQLDLSPYSQLQVSAGSEQLTYESSYTDDSGAPALRIWESAGKHHFRLAYYDGIQFWLERGEKEIWAVWPATSSLEAARSYLIGPVFGILLRLRGVTFLHASAMVLNDQAVAFVGAEGRNQGMLPQHRADWKQAYSFHRTLPRRFRSCKPKVAARTK